jgi:trehalose utilization protein
VCKGASDCVIGKERIFEFETAAAEPSASVAAFEGGEVFKNSLDWGRRGVGGNGEGGVCPGGEGIVGSWPAIDMEA